MVENNPPGTRGAFFDRRMFLFPHGRILICTYNAAKIIVITSVNAPYPCKHTVPTSISYLLGSAGVR